MELTFVPASKVLWSATIERALIRYDVDQEDGQDLVEQTYERMTKLPPFVVFNILTSQTRQEEYDLFASMAFSESLRVASTWLTIISSVAVVVSMLSCPWLLSWFAAAWLMTVLFKWWCFLRFEQVTRSFVAVRLVNLVLTEMLGGDEVVRDYQTYLWSIDS